MYSLEPYMYTVNSHYKHIDIAGTGLGMLITNICLYGEKIRKPSDTGHKEDTVEEY